MEYVYNFKVGDRVKIKIRGLKYTNKRYTQKWMEGHEATILFLRNDNVILEIENYKGERHKANYEDIYLI